MGSSAISPALTERLKAVASGADLEGAGATDRLVHWIAYQDYYNQTDKLFRLMDEAQLPTRGMNGQHLSKYGHYLCTPPSSIARGERR
ncbi:MAG: hypothetical protein DBP00_15630 [gamma proteobacterium symbiont of Ctena orbiculata]|nr:MAG: hypothetical protein DBP00_15630 [gamma proteobacterium symbiont of Ctena orbiculata]